MLRSVGWILGLGVAGGLVAGALARGRLRILAAPPPSTSPVRFGGDLVEGQTYRVWLTAPEESVDTVAIEERLLVSGFGPIATAKDPTDGRVWTSVAVWRGPGTGSENIPPIAIYRTDPADPPPPAARPGPPTLDPGISSTEAMTVDVALRTETDPVELSGFADACAIDFPAAESLLRARAGEVSRNAIHSLVDDAVRVPPSGVPGMWAATKRVASTLFGDEAAAGVSFGAVRKDQISIQKSYEDLQALVRKEQVGLQKSYQEQAWEQARDARLLREASTKVSFADEYERVTRFFQTHDEYGTPFVPLSTSFDRLGGGRRCPPGYSYLYAYGTMLEDDNCTENAAGWPVRYVPRFPPAPSYDSWIPRMKLWVPKAWSGDATTKPIRPGLTFDEAQDPSNLVLDHTLFEMEWNYQQEDLYRANVQNFLSTLADNGWGRYHRVRSAFTDEPGNPNIWGFRMTFTTRTFFSELWELTSAVGKSIALAIKAVAPFLKIIPGLGTALSIALTVAAGLALGENIGDTVLNGLAAALPGGEAVKAAFNTGLTVVTGMIDGKAWDEIALEIARKQAVALGGEGAAAGFDVAVAIAQGKNLQELGFGVLVGLVPGGALLNKGKEFARAAARAASQGIEVGELLVRELKSELTSLGSQVGSQMIGQTIDAVVASVREAASDGSLLEVPSPDMATKLGVPEAVARAAQAVVKLLDDGTPIVDVDLLLRLKPPPPVTKEGAYKLASYEDQRLTAKGHISGNALLVAAPARLPEIVRDINRGALAGEPAAKEARAAIDRATRSMKRQTYVQRYLKEELARN